jgi:hypothetical protein
LAFRGVPVFQHLRSGLGVRVAEHMRVARDEFLSEVLHHLLNIERARFAGDLTVHQHLQQQVAEFLAQFGGVGAVDGFQRLVGFLQQVGLEALVGLLAIPWAAVGGAQRGDHAR